MASIPRHGSPRHNLWTRARRGIYGGTVTNGGAPGPGAAPAVRNRWRSRLGIAGAVALALALLVRAALPFALEWSVPRVAQRYGFAASIASVDLGLLAGRMTVEGLRLAAADPAGAPARDLLALGSASINLEWLKLLRGQIDLAELVLEKPVLSLVRNADGTLALPQLPAGDEPEAVREPAPPEDPLPIALETIAIRGTEFHLVDGTGGPELVQFTLSELEPSDLTLVGTNVGLGGIRISEPWLRVRRELRTTRTGASEPAPAPSGATPSPAREVRIDRLDIDRADFAVVTDDGEAVQVALHLRTRDVSLDPDATFPVDFGLTADE